MAESPFSVDVAPDWEAFRACILREGTPARVHVIELFLDVEVQDEIARRYGVLDGLDREAPFLWERRQIALQRFLGYDYVCCGVGGLDMPLNRTTIDDTAELKREAGRAFMDEHTGPITNWDEFEAYPWPDVANIDTRALEWYEKNLPDDMCILARGVGHFCEHVAWLMGYETLCYALYDRRDLVEAIAKRLLEKDRVVLRRFLEFDRVKIVWTSDDMGFRSATFISPDDMREFVLAGHRELAETSHAAGRPYILHACGNLDQIMDDLIDDVKIDGKHSFEDTIEDVRELKDGYGSRIALLGGIDVDFLCRAGESDIRRRVRETLSICHPGGGYCLGSGNSVANYVPVDNYLAMLDEGRKFGG